MPTVPMNKVIEHLQRITAPHAGDSHTDGQLLECFCDEQAFATLVHRHGRMVLGVCQRVLHNRHDADDAFQATFLVLVRKATTLLQRRTVGDWLYGVACHVALKARSAAARRRDKERQARQMPTLEQPTEDVLELRAVLDRELNRLPVKYRTPLVLCDMEEKTRKEVAELLGWPEGTVSSRLSRGRSLLAGRLQRRGLVFSAGTLGLVLEQQASSACVSSALLGSTVEVACLLASGEAASPGVVPVRVAALTHGVLKAMVFAKVKRALALLLVVAVLGAGAGLLAQAGFAGSLLTGGNTEQPAKRSDGLHAISNDREKPEGQGALQRFVPQNQAEVWTLDFRFKDLRALQFTPPGRNGDVKKTIWYLRYEIANPTGAPRLFVPEFEIEAAGRVGIGDEVLPTALEQIAKVEDVTGELDLKDSITIAAQPIPPTKADADNRGLAGVATWDHVDTDVKELSIFVSGVSNDWRVAQPVPLDREPEIQRKTLRLDFKRRADQLIFVPPAQWVYRPAKLAKAKEEKPICWWFTIKEEDGSTVLAMDGVTLVFDGVRRTGMSWGVLQVAGPGEGMGALGVGNRSLVQSYAGGICTLTYAGHTLQLIEAGSKLICGKQAFDLHGGKKTIKVKANGAAEVVRTELESKDKQTLARLVNQRRQVEQQRIDQIASGIEEAIKQLRFQLPDATEEKAEEIRKDIAHLEKHLVLAHKELVKIELENTHDRLRRLVEDHEKQILDLTRELQRLQKKLESGQ